MRNSHDAGHAARVAYLATMIAQTLRMEPENLCRLQIAASLHDLGRTNHSEDASHGDRSVEIAAQMGLSLDETTAQMIRYHSRGDRAARRLPPQAQRLLWILKDADALDRVRSGDLDVSFLRFNESVSFLPLAQRLWEGREP